MTYLCQSYKEKLVKAREIGLIYFSRYMNWHKSPNPDMAFLRRIQSDKSHISKLLFQTIDENKVIHDANKICSGEMKIYEISSSNFKNNLNWHKDYYSGYVWPLRPFIQIYYSTNKGIDLNVPIQLSALQFIPTLIQALKCTGQKKYGVRLIELIDSWIRQNPYCFGINWCSGMAVALRALNLILVISFAASHISRKKLRSYLNVLWKHALYIHRYDIMMDKVKNKNNHFLVAMLGLLAVSQCFEGSKAEKFRTIAQIALAKEITRQFREDGGNFESALGYHQFSLEAVLVGILFMRTYLQDNVSEDFVGVHLGNDIKKRLINALNLTSDYMNCYGQSPQIGDSSDYRVIVFKEYFDRKAYDHSFLFRLGEFALNYRVPEKQGRIAKLRPRSGYAFFKNKHYGIVGFGGPKGTDGGGGHGHNDKCSFVMQVKGHPIIVDSGTYIYNAVINERYEFKRTKAHNTVIINDQEQCVITPEIVFGLLSQINSQIKMAEDDEVTKIQMEHDGYRRLNEVGLVSREMVCQLRTIEINDAAHGSGSHNISIFLNLHPSVTGKILSNTVNIPLGSYNINVILPRSFQLHLENSFYSDSYHARIKNFRIVASANMTLPTSWKTIIEIL